MHAVATLGATISKEQRKLLKQYFNQIILLADNDEAGERMSDKMKTYFGSGCVTPSLPKEIKDVSDMSDEELKIFVDRLDDLGSLMIELSNAHI
jgi:DNA primase